MKRFLVVGGEFVGTPYSGPVCIGISVIGDFDTYDEADKCIGEVYENYRGVIRMIDTKPIENITIKLMSWFTGTKWNNVKHPLYGEIELNPIQIRKSSKEYRESLIKQIKEARQNGIISDDMVESYS